MAYLNSCKFIYKLYTKRVPLIITRRHPITRVTKIISCYKRQPYNTLAGLSQVTRKFPKHKH